MPNVVAPSALSRWSMELAVLKAIVGDGAIFTQLIPLSEPTTSAVKYWKLALYCGDVIPFWVSDQ
jgi:hypothetical protein